MLDQIIKPMEPVKHDQPFDDPRYAFQVKWDGVRMLAFVSGSGVRLQNRRLREKTATYPELQLLSKHLVGRDAILDGEVVVLQDGKPSFPRVIERDFATSSRTISGMQKTHPIAYVVFDILWLDGRDLTPLPWQERDQHLHAAVREEDGIAVIDSFLARGTDLFGAVETKGLEGIVAKEISSRYLIGQKSDAWRKIKTKQRIRAVVGGMTIKGSHFSALLLGVYREGQLVYIGRVGTGISMQEAGLLVQHLGQQRQPTSPFTNTPRITSAEVIWTYPALTVDVEFMEWTEDLQLRAPVIKGFGIGDPKECVFC
ncbi:MAG: non-homologous end-joining DNA ligase [Bacillota bacterium]